MRRRHQFRCERLIVIYQRIFHSFVLWHHEKLKQFSVKHYLIAGQNGAFEFHEWMNKRCGECQIKFVITKTIKSISKELMDNRTFGAAEVVSTALIYANIKEDYYRLIRVHEWMVIHNCIRWTFFFLPLHKCMWPFHSKKLANIKSGKKAIKCSANIEKRYKITPYSISTYTTRDNTRIHFEHSFTLHGIH